MQLSELCNEILKRRGFYKQTLVYETTQEPAKIAIAIGNDLNALSTVYRGDISIDGNVRVQKSISLSQAVVVIPIFNILSLSRDFEENFSGIILFQKNNSHQIEYLNTAIVVNGNPDDFDEDLQFTGDKTSLFKCFIVSDQELKYKDVTLKYFYTSEIKKIHPSLTVGNLLLLGG